MSRILKIGSEEIPPGKNVQVSLTVARLPTRTKIEIPAFVYNGPKEGPGILLLAGMHGDEINGVEILRRMIYNKMVKPVRGHVIILPLLNIYGFLHFNRGTPGGKDVNRSFPGSKSGSLASIVAYHLMQEIFPLIDLGVDFHTGGGSLKNFPHIRCDFKYPFNLELANAFAPPMILNSRLVDRSFRKEAQKQNKSIIVYEGGESLRLDEYAVQEGVKGALRVMNHFEVTEETLERETPLVMQSSTWLRARNAGIFKFDVKEGEWVKRNQLLGVISDPYGEHETLLKAPRQGYIVSINHMPVVNRGDALINLAYDKKN